MIKNIVIAITHENAQGYINCMIEKDGDKKHIEAMARILLNEYNNTQLDYIEFKNIGIYTAETNSPYFKALD